FLPRRDVAPVESVGVLGRGEAGILTDGPRLRDIHGGVRPAQVGRDARVAVEEVEARRVGGGVGLLDGDALGCEPSVGAGRGRMPWLSLGRIGSRKGSHPFQWDLGKIGYPAHPRCLLRMAA